MNDSYMTPSASVSLFKHRLDGRIDTHWHEFFEMGFVVSGSGTHVLNGVPERLGRGSAFLLTPADFHSLEPDAGETLELYDLIFNDRFIREPMLELLFDHGVRHTAVYGGAETVAGRTGIRARLGGIRGRPGGKRHAGAGQRRTAAHSIVPAGAGLRRQRAMMRAAPICRCLPPCARRLFTSSIISARRSRLTMPPQAADCRRIISANASARNGRHVPGVRAGFAPAVRQVAAEDDAAAGHGDLLRLRLQYAALFRAGLQRSVSRTPRDYRKR